jgi:hypothetical protein
MKLTLADILNRSSGSRLPGLPATCEVSGETDRLGGWEKKADR